MRLHSPERPSSQRFTVLSVMILFALSVLQYSYSFQNDFVWDSETVFLKDPAIRNVKHLPRFFTEEFVKETEASDYVTGLTYYRPLVKVLHLVEYTFFGQDPIGYNSVNIVLNALVVVLAFIFIRDVTGRARLALLASMLYAVNPSRVEAVSWAYSDSYILAAMFSLLALISYHRGNYGRSNVWYALSLLAKESSILLPAVLVAYEFLVRSERRPRGYVKIVPFLGITVFYLAARSAAVGAVPVADTDVITFLNAASFVMVTCVRIFFLPDAAITIYHHEEGMFSALSPEFVVSHLVSALLLGIAVVLWRRRRPYLFWYLWFFLWLLILLNVGKYGEYYMADKLLYLPALGFCVILARAALDLERARKAAVGLVLTMSLIHFGITYYRTTFWMDNITYLEKAKEHVSGFFLLHSKLGTAYVKKGEYDKALKEYEVSLKAYAPQGRIHLNMGNIKYMKGDIDGAVAAWREAIKWEPGDPMPYHNLCIAMEDTGRGSEGLRYCRKFLSLNPQVAAGMIQRVREIVRRAEGHTGKGGR